MVLNAQKANTLTSHSRFMKLALQGTTVLVASGDNGIAANTGEDTTNGCVGPKSTVFNPNYFRFVCQPDTVADPN